MVPLPSPQQLRYLVALAETRHFGRAALACAGHDTEIAARSLGGLVPGRTLRRRPEIVEPLGVQTAFHVIPAKAGT